MYTSFGYLNTVGYAGHLFPIVMVSSLSAALQRFQCSRTCQPSAAAVLWLVCIARHELACCRGVCLQAYGVHCRILPAALPHSTAEWLSYCDLHAALPWACWNCILLTSTSIAPSSFDDMYVMQGETGSFFATATDIQSMADIAAYARADKDTGVPHTPLQAWLMTQMMHHRCGWPAITPLACCNEAVCNGHDSSLDRWSRQMRTMLHAEGRSDATYC